ncbi:GGDEF domain-containing protein [Poseidonibacter lekithochrous]|uniref:GGDEF domain-containing protein n=1 Tax=Poseidonibacter TaxID=2321187 RepID=UPI001C086370|nr:MULTISPECIES: GGDEF domain-containing protein [Poseidonibacter]MBU3013142.1 GGDEF domain-containing protein [Poseidonibacter lekithochrous]MDO6826438.1 GGDEF domain-containing protein [Poseidonibacter sp. 1_MG-2023]
MGKKLIILSFILSLILSITIVSLTLLNSKKSNIKATIIAAESISNVVIHNLNTFMVNDNMHNSKAFINSLSNIKGINNLWLVRSELLNDKYVNSQRHPKDDIDKKVLSSGLAQYEIKEDLTKTTMRISIPYNANIENGVNCFSCHNVAQGDTLGAVSLDLDIESSIEGELELVYLIPLLIFISIFTIIYLSSRNIKSYENLFDSLKNSINEASTGNFDLIVKPKILNSEMKDTIDKYNNLMVILKDAFVDIEKRMQRFIGNKSTMSSNNPLEESKDIILNLSNLYQFKKEIELDNTKEEIYDRLAQVFENQFGIESFTFLEINMNKHKMNVVKEVGNTFYCKEYIKENPELCRSARTNNDVVSIDYHNSCPYFKEKDKYHYCTNIDISKEVNLIINFVCKTPSKLENLKDKISFVKSYINEAAPSIEVKLLMDALQESAFTDGLTGLYNRKFLEEHAKKLIPHAKREEFNIGVLLLDMDHFKAVNDEYGHDIGDKVLKELARIMTECIRESDIIIRYGGEEFIILLVGVSNVENAMNIANKIGKRVRENEIDVYAGNKLKKTISIGLSMFPDDATSLDSAIKNADIALYEAKNSGRDKVVKFNEEQISSVDLF